MEKIQTRIKAIEISGHDDAGEDIIIEVERDGKNTWVQMYNYNGMGASPTDISLKSLPHVILALERIKIELEEDLPKGDQDGE